MISVLRIYILIFFSTLTFALPAQTYIGPIYLYTQAEVDSFPLHYPPMDRLLGGLQIGRAPVCDIHDLSALPHFKYMDQLLIVNTQLISLESFVGVDTIYRCRILANPVLKDLHGLEGWKHNYEYFVLADNPALTSLAGLDSLQSSDSNIIQHNEGLVSLEGALQLNRIYELSILNNPRLKTLSGFPAMRRCPYLRVTANDSLEHFGGFPQLDSIFSQLYVESNPRLKDFVGFNNGHTLRAGSVSIQNNPALESLAGLEHLRRVGSVLYIIGNHRLPQVVLDSLQSAYIAEISGDLIDSIQLPALRWGVVKIHDCPSLVRLHNVLPVADSIRWDIYDNANLLSIHEDTGPKKLLRFHASGPLLESVTGFDSTLLCAGRYNSWDYYEGLSISSPKLRKVVGFRNVRAGFIGLAMPYGTKSMERVEGFDHIETALGSLNFSSYDSSGNNTYDVGIKVLRGFQNLRRCIDAQFNIHLWVKDTMIGFQIVDSLIGVSSISGIGWADTCYVDPAAFSKLAYTQANFGVGGDFSWPLPSLQRIDRTLFLGGNARPYPFEGMFPALKTVGAIGAWNTQITSLRGLEGITRFNRISFWDDFLHLENNPNLSDCSAVCTWLEHALFSPPQLKEKMVITNNPLFPCTDKATLLSWCDTVTAVQAPLPDAATLTRGGELLVYPNPVQQGMVYFRLPESVLGTTFQVSVYDLQGRAKVIRTDRFTADYAVPVGDWPSGIYILQVQTQERVWAATIQTGP